MYTLELSEWIVDYERPTNSPRIAPFKVARSNQFQALLVNNSFPGPALSAFQDDTIEVHVLNNLMKDDITLVWNGLNVVNAPKGLIIPQGGVGRYTLTAPSVGTFWWHATVPEQTASGLFGGFVVHKDPDAQPKNELMAVMADARVAPNVCFDGYGKWDSRSCPMGAAGSKATLNGQWGDDSKDYPKPVMQVKEKECYTLRLLGVSLLPGSMFDFSIDKHHFSLPDGQRNLPSLTVKSNADQGVDATFCANQPRGVFSHDYDITYSFYNASAASSKQRFGAILRYV
jgi:FtsP/CotA-like multicopper oxidase with cupredoxin domain